MGFSIHSDTSAAHKADCLCVRGLNSERMHCCSFGVYGIAILFLIFASCLSVGGSVDCLLSPP